MSVFTGRMTKVKDISNRRRLPRLAKIRQGFKIKKGDKEYPAELPFFLLPEDVARKHGGKVTVERARELGVTRQDVLTFIAGNLHRLAEELPIMLPINDIEAVFPQSYTMYGASRGVKCRGNGEIAEQYDEVGKGIKEVECPCSHLKGDDNPKGDCMLRAHLLCLIPDVSMGGIMQISCSSYNSIVDINSGIDYVSAMIGRFAMVPLTLRKIPIDTHHDGKKQIHFTMQLLLNVPIEQVEGLRKDTSRILTNTSVLAIEHEDINPATEEPDMVIDAEVLEPPVSPNAETPPASENLPEEKKEPVAPVKLTNDECKKKLSAATSVENLKTIWDALHAENKADRSLKAYCSKVKAELSKKGTTAPPEGGKKQVDMLKLQELFKEAPDEAAVKMIWDEAEPHLEGEDMASGMMMRDRRLGEIRG